MLTRGSLDLAALVLVLTVADDKPEVSCDSGVLKSGIGRAQALVLAMKKVQHRSDRAREPEKTTRTDVLELWIRL